MKTLIIIDLQAAFRVPPELVVRIEKFSQDYECRVFTRFVNPQGSLFRRKLGMRDCSAGTPDTNLLLKPRDEDLVLDKEGYGLRPEHIVRLTARGVTRADICGIDTDACVLGVMFSLFDAGIDCRVLPGFCWSSSGLDEEAMRIMNSQFSSPA